MSASDNRSKPCLLFAVPNMFYLFLPPDGAPEGVRDLLRAAGARPALRQEERGGRDGAVQDVHALQKGKSNTICVQPILIQQRLISKAIVYLFQQCADKVIRLC